MKIKKSTFKMVIRIKKSTFTESKKVHLPNQKRYICRIKKSTFDIVVQIPESKKVQRTVTQFGESSESMT